jgi:hypothetical protein
MDGMFYVTSCRRTVQMGVRRPVHSYQMNGPRLAFWQWEVGETSTPLLKMYKIHPSSNV